jgi:hypothetical protein
MDDLLGSVPESVRVRITHVEKARVVFKVTSRIPYKNLKGIDMIPISIIMLKD